MRIHAAVAPVLTGLLLATIPTSASAVSPIPPPHLELLGSHNAGQADVLIVKGSRWTAGGTIRIVQMASPGERRRLVAVKTSNRHGDVRVRVSDLNGADPTRYRAFLVAVEGEYERAVSNRRAVR